MLDQINYKVYCTRCRSKWNRRYIRKGESCTVCENRLCYCCNFCNKDYATRSGAIYHLNYMCKIKNPFKNSMKKLSEGNDPSLLKAASKTSAKESMEKPKNVLPEGEIFKEDQSKNLTELSDPLIDPLQMTSEPFFTCTKCSKIFKGRENLRQHHKTCLAIKRIKPMRSLTYICNMCDYKTFKRHLLRKHVQHSHTSTNQKYHKCPTCDRQYMHLKHLRAHQRNVCGQQQNHTCDHCEYKTSCKLYMARHLKKRHSDIYDDSKFKCKLCDVDFLNLRQLSQHLLRNECPKYSI